MIPPSVCLNKDEHCLFLLAALQSKWRARYAKFMLLSTFTTRGPVIVVLHNPTQRPLLRGWIGCLDSALLKCGAPRL